MSTEIYGVFAATGKQGGAVAEELLERGKRVRALVRRPDSEPARALAARGAEVVVADVDRTETLIPAMRGLDALWFMTTMTPELGAAAEMPMGRALAAAAVDAGVARIVFSSVGGAERDTGVPHFDSKWEVEKHLADLDLEVTVIRPVFFMDNLPFMTDSDGEEVVLRMPLPDGIPLQMVSVRDIGRVAATVLSDPGAVSGGAVEIAGDELTGGEVAAQVGEALGRAARYEALPLEALGEDADARAMFAWFADLPAYRADFAATDSLAIGSSDLRGWLTSTAWPEIGA
jgi:uncharacterized protein YbjT (DUF2867 family)